MRIDGGTKASGGQQAQSRFEQAMARELSRPGGAKTSAESAPRADLSAAASKRKAPGSERAGTDFKSTEAGKTLKGLQDATRQVLSKTMGQAGETAKGAFAKLAAAAEGATGKAKAGAQAFGEGMAKAGFGKEGAAFGKAAAGEGTSAGKEGAAAGKSGPGEGAAFGKGMAGEGATLGKGAAGEGAATVSTGREGGTAAQTSGSSGTGAGTSTGTGTQAQGDGPRTGSPAGTQTSTQSGPAGAQTSAPSTPATTPTQGAGAERAATAATPAPTEAPGAAPATTTTGAEASAGQDGRAVALAAQNTPLAPEVLAFLQNPWLQSAAKKAAANGAELSMVFQLGANVHGAEFVSVATDDTGFITGPEIEITLSRGAVDTNGNWVAQRGEGMLKGAQITLEADADGCVFVSDGEPDNPATVTARIVGAEALHADVVAVRKLR